MSLAPGERQFSKIAALSTESELWQLVMEWMPWFTRKKGSAYYDGDWVREGFREAGFAPTQVLHIPHDRLITMARRAAASADLVAAANCVIYACGNPNRDRERWKGPLRSIACIKQLPRHKNIFDPKDPYDSCHICGNVANIEFESLSTACDFVTGFAGEDCEVLTHTVVCRWFAKAVLPDLHPEDFKNFRRFLTVVAEAEPKATAVQISKLVRKELGGRVDHWRYLFETLGYAGVLRTDKLPGYLQAWTNAHERARLGRAETPAPMKFWKRHMGFDAKVFRQLFPKIRLPASLKSSS